MPLPSTVGPYFLRNFPLTTHVRVFDAAKLRTVLQYKTCIDWLGCFVWIPNSQQHRSYHFVKALAIQRNYGYVQFGTNINNNLPFRWYCPSWHNCIDSYRKDFLLYFSHNMNHSKPFVWTWHSSGMWDDHRLALFRSKVTIRKKAISVMKDLVWKTEKKATNWNNIKKEATNWLVEKSISWVY